LKWQGLREQLSELDLEKNKQDVKFLVISNYLDVYKILINRKFFRTTKNWLRKDLKISRNFISREW
jgi:hypothetical protein